MSIFCCWQPECPPKFKMEVEVTMFEIWAPKPSYLDSYLSIYLIILCLVFAPMKLGYRIYIIELL